MASDDKTDMSYLDTECTIRFVLPVGIGAFAGGFEIVIGPVIRQLALRAPDYFL